MPSRWPRRSRRHASGVSRCARSWNSSSRSRPALRGETHVSGMHCNGGLGGRWRYLGRRGHRAHHEKTSREDWREKNPHTTQIKGEVIMTKTNIEHPRVVSRDQWLAAREVHLANEKELT